MASRLVRVTQTDSACLKDSCQSSELSNALEPVRNTLKASVPAALFSLCRMDRCTRGLSSRSRCMTLLSCGVESGMAARSSVEGGPHGPFVYSAMLRFFFAYLSSSQLASHCLCCGKWVPLKSGELGLGRLGSPLASTVGRRLFILNASGFWT